MLTLLEPDYSFRAPPRILTTAEWEQPFHPPYRRYDKTPGMGYNDGYDTASKWTSDWIPAGPHVVKPELRIIDDPQWDAYCALTQQVNDQFKLGFAAGLADKKLRAMLMERFGDDSHAGTWQVFSGHEWFNEPMKPDLMERAYRWLTENVEARWYISQEAAHFLHEGDATLFHLWHP